MQVCLIVITVKGLLIISYFAALKDIFSPGELLNRGDVVIIDLLLVMLLFNLLCQPFFIQSCFISILKVLSKIVSCVYNLGNCHHNIMTIFS